MKLKRTFISLTKSYIEDETAATAIEYGLIAALIAVAGIAGMKYFGTQTHRFFWCLSHTMGGGADHAKRFHSCRTLGIHQ